MIHGDLLGERARVTPEREALVEAGSTRRWTYAQLDQAARRCAWGWTHELGLEPGDRVGFLAHNRVEYLVAFFAAAKSGVVLVPLGTRLVAEELAYMLQDSGARALVYDGALAQVTTQLRDKLTLDHWLALDEPVDPRDRRFGELGPKDAGQKWTNAPVDPEDLLCLIYTSGTTGRPKGVMLPHRMVSWNAYNTVVSWRLRDDDVTSVFTPFYHAAGLSVFLTPLFLVGGKVVLHQGFDPAEVLQTMERERCTVVLGVPTIFKMLLEHPNFTQADFSRVRWLISGGAPLPTYLVEAYAEKGAVLKQGFGMTEVGVNCFAMTTGEAQTKLGSIGKPMLFTEARVVDAAGHDLAPSQVGELLLRGPHVCRGYWNNPEATAAALDADGWFHTGDSARFDEDGFFYIAGRKKDMFISGGVNVYPAEIEAALLLHPLVADAAVVGVPDDKWGESGAAFVVLRKGAPVDERELRNHLKNRLARYKLPKVFHFENELPRTAYGKVQKHLLIQKTQHTSD